MATINIIKVLSSFKYNISNTSRSALSYTYVIYIFEAQPRVSDADKQGRN